MSVGRGRLYGVVRAEKLTDEDWSRIEPLLPVGGAKGGRPWADHRRVVEAILWRYRTGSPWRDLPDEFGPWITAYKRHRRFAGDGTWDKVFAEVLKSADAAGLIGWDVSVDSTVNRAHQHATNLPRTDKPTGG